ncbi:alcohol dehydrogenase transcription factor myb/SANT-like domain-containing protein [Phthorimaea operculella]|nr:alcohol dehydrogenase transcription factor myb/SANT-like domain-containing protein [Phthorimaea operculella]
MREDVEFNVKFCSLVAKNPALYDLTRSDCIRSVQERIWRKIASELNESVADCRDRWKNIRNRYCKCYKKRISTDDVSTVKEYYLGPHLRFLDKFIKPRPNRKLPYVPKEEGTTDGTNEAIEDDNDNFGYENEESNQSFDKNPEIPIVDSFDKPSEIPLVEPGKVFISKRSLSSAEEENARTFDDRTQPQNPLEEFYSPETQRTNLNIESIETVDPSDSDFYFLKSLLPDMAEMNPAQKRRFKTRMMNLIAEILDGHDTSVSMNYAHKKPRKASN